MMVDKDVTNRLEMLALAIVATVSACALPWGDAAAPFFWNSKLKTDADFTQAGKNMRDHANAETQCQGRRFQCLRFSPAGSLERSAYQAAVKSVVTMSPDR